MKMTSRMIGIVQSIRRTMNFEHRGLPRVEVLNGQAGVSASARLAGVAGTS